MTKKIYPQYLKATRSVLAVFSLMMTTSLAALAQSGIGSDSPPPAEAGKDERSKYDTYNGNIELIASNEGNGLFKFLADHEDKIVFIDSAVLRYVPAPPGVTEKTRDLIPPTDRYENTVVKNCWGPEIDKDGLLESDENGFPLPENDTDIQNGCRTRLKFEFIKGDYGSDNIKSTFGYDKNETFFVGFFEIKKETLKSEKILYRLVETSEIKEETIKDYYAYGTLKERRMRKLEVDVEPATGETQPQ